MNNNTSPAKLHYSWTDMHRDCLNLVAQLKQRAIPDVIIGLERGGVIPASLISREFSNTRLDTVKWQTRDGGVQDSEKISFLCNQYREIWLIDDMCDSGLTAHMIKQLCKPFDVNITYIALFNNTEALSCADLAIHHFKRTEDDRWIVFPWE